MGYASLSLAVKIEINLYSKCTRSLYCYFWLRGKPVENTSISLLIISPRPLHNFLNFPRYANHRCTGHAIMSTEHGNDRLITAHAPFSSHITVCGFLGFVKSFFFLKTPDGNLPVRSRRKPLCVKGRQNYPARSLRWLARKIFFWSISGTDFDTPGTRLLRESAQGLF